MTCRNNFLDLKIDFMSAVTRCHFVTHSNAVLMEVKGDFQSNCSAAALTHNCSFIHFNFAGSSSSHALELPGEIAPKSDFWSLCMQDLLKILLCKDTLY